MLAAEVDVNKSTLDRVADSDLVDAAKRVSTAARTNAAVLASDYKVTAEELTALEEATTTFDGMKTSPRDAIVERKVATLSLPDAISFVRSIYRNEIDKMMTKFKKTAPDFHSGYFAARMIVNRGHAPKPDDSTSTGATSGTTQPPKPNP